MVLELHIWGPAFGLPSIDTQCLATVAYFTRAVPRSEWVLVASSDPAVCPERECGRRGAQQLVQILTFHVLEELPAVKNGSLWVSRFRNIVDYLRKYSDGQWHLDADLESQQKADCLA